MDSGQTGEKVLTWGMGWEVKPRPWQAPCEHWEMKMGWLDWGVWGGFSDLLGDLSALSSYEDALAEAEYEELDYLVTQKEGLLDIPGGCLCLPSWDLSLAVFIFSASAAPTHAPDSQRQLLQSGRMASQSPVSPQPPSTLHEPGLFFLILNTGLLGMWRVIL